MSAKSKKLTDLLLKNCHSYTSGNPKDYIENLLDNTLKWKGLNDNGNKALSYQLFDRDVIPEIIKFKNDLSKKENISLETLMPINLELSNLYAKYTQDSKYPNKKNALKRLIELLSDRNLLAAIQDPDTLIAQDLKKVSITKIESLNEIIGVLKIFLNRENEINNYYDPFFKEMVLVPIKTFIESHNSGTDVTDESINQILQTLVNVNNAYQKLKNKKSQSLNILTNEILSSNEILALRIQNLTLSWIKSGIEKFDCPRDILVKMKSIVNFKTEDSIIESKKSEVIDSCFSNFNNALQAYKVKFPITQPSPADDLLGNYSAAVSFLEKNHFDLNSLQNFSLCNSTFESILNTISDLIKIYSENIPCHNFIVDINYLNTKVQAGFGDTISKKINDIIDSPLKELNLKKANTESLKKVENNVLILCKTPYITGSDLENRKNTIEKALNILIYKASISIIKGKIAKINEILKTINNLSISANEMFTSIPDYTQGLLNNFHNSFNEIYKCWEEITKENLTRFKDINILYNYARSALGIDHLNQTLLRQTKILAIAYRAHPKIQITDDLSKALMNMLALLSYNAENKYFKNVVLLNKTTKFLSKLQTKYKITQTMLQKIESIKDNELIKDRWEKLNIYKQFKNE